MKKLIVLFSAMVVAAGASAQTERTATNPVQAQQQDRADRQAPLKGEKVERENRWQESIESANTVDPDFQGRSSQHTTASGMGQPQTATEGKERSTAADKTSGKATVDTQDVEDKNKK